MPSAYRFKVKLAAALRDTQSDLRKKKAALDSELSSLRERIEF